MGKHLPDTTYDLTPETGTVTFSISATPNTTAPLVDAGSDPAILVEDGGTAAPFQDLVLTDPDSPVLYGFTLSGRLAPYSFSYVSSSIPYNHLDNTTFRSPFRSSYQSSTGLLKVTGQASAAAYQELLRNLSIESYGDAPTTSPILLTLTIDDGQYKTAVEKNLLITPVNDAPELIDTINPTLPAAGSGSLWPGRVDEFMAVSDPDGAAALPSGIAINGMSGPGTWSWSGDGGATFTDITGATAEAALLLAPQAILRYTPLVDMNESAFLTYRAWDQSQGSAGATLDTTVNGGSTPFSSRQGRVHAGDAPPPVFVPTGQVIHDDMIPNSGSAVLGDLDGDGDLDAFLSGATETGYFSEIWFNDGSGTFTFQKDFSEYDPYFALEGIQSKRPHLADIDNDGDQDLILWATCGMSGAWYQAWESRIYENDGYGQFSLRQILSSSSGSLVTEDFNGDGYIDLIFSTHNLWLNDGNGYFIDNDTFRRHWTSFYDTVHAGDMDGDGDTDVLVKSQSGEGETFFYYDLNNGDATFNHVSYSIYGSRHSRLADTDSDGDLDFSDTVITAFNSGNALLSRVKTSAWGGALTPFIDLDGDGDVDTS